MMFQEGLFLILATLAVVSALMVVLLDNPVRCALFLVATFIASSGIWLLAHAEFLALILVLVYVGAVMTLFLFVIMMLDTERMAKKRYFMRYLPFGLVVVAFLTGLMLMAIKPEHFGNLLNADAVNNMSNISNTESLGLVLYTIYAYPLEVAAVLLLVAIVSAIVLAHRPPRNSKVQQLAEQLVVTKTDRLSIVKVDSQNEYNTKI